MSNDRTHAGIDGAELVERMSLEIAIRYLGGPTDKRVEGLLLGLARHTTGMETMKPKPTHGFEDKC
jgi:hypothetical protein